MTLIVRDDLAHVLEVLVVVFARVLFGVLFEDGDDFASAARTKQGGMGRLVLDYLCFCNGFRGSGLDCRTFRARLIRLSRRLCSSLLFRMRIAGASL